MPWAEAWEDAASLADVRRYGVRRLRTYSLRDQLGPVPSTKSKIEDGSAMGKALALGAAVADFRFL